MFAAVGIGTDLLNVDRSDPPHLLIAIILNGVIAAAFAWGWARGPVVLLYLGAATAIAHISINKVYPQIHHDLSLEQIRSSIILHGLLITAFIVLGYILLTAFVGSEGKRFFAAHTEIELAAGIQRALVPPLSVTCDGFEAYGISLPSGAIGGDLFDIVPCGAASFAYVADVSGHGVKAGVLMSMVKASVRTHFAVPGMREEKVLESLNDVLYPLTDAGTYATIAFVLIQGGRPLLFSLAGHLPIFHFKHQLGKVEQCSVENFPVAMFPDVRFEVSTLEAAAGDVVAIVTDGLTELSNKKGAEIGYGYIEKALRDSARSPLKEIAAGIVKTSEQFGTPVDDRTLLLIRLS
ncbi:MAG TPA: PP2C family protein-serine/threonine phosphatase [Bryobacteraceae bacterium]|nr:PP2C family protein-serine/threonine phosphatase [Bryobacteraceae bacterium]